MTTQPDPTTAQPNADQIAITRRLALGGMLGVGLTGLIAACGSSSKSAASTSLTSTSPVASTAETTAVSTAPTAASTTTAVAPKATDVVATTAASASCVLTKEQEQGPFYFALAHVRSDIIDGQDGVPINLRLTVMDSVTCKPIANAAVDVWMADAKGDYSDSSTGLFLRGIQVTGNDGLAAFTSIYPGWYPGRTNHVHVKVRVGGTAADTYTGGHASHTGNLFFPEDVSLAVAKQPAYLKNPATRTTLTTDFVYKGQNGSGSIMTLTPNKADDPSQGYVAATTLGVYPNATPALIGIAGTIN